jgi:hypothetical protein
MREGTIIIGGKNYPVKCLTVLQSLQEDMQAADANTSKEPSVRAAARVRRMAIALQNAEAFLPDPKNPNGEIGVADLKIDQVIGLLNSGIFTDMDEFYDAELVVLKMLHPRMAAGAAREAAPAEGESPATG